MRAFPPAMIVFATMTACAPRPSEMLDCEVIQAAFSANAGEAATVYPQDLLEIREKPARVLAGDDLGVTTSELKQLDADYVSKLGRSYKPHCTWRGAPKRIVIGGEVVRSSFTRPVYASGRRLAVLDLVLQTDRHEPEAQTCVMRRAGQAWTVTCREGPPR